MKTPIFPNLSIKEKFDIIFGIVQITLIVITIIFAFKAYRQTNNLFKAQNRPNLIVTENFSDSTNYLILWNMGPGVAYEIKVEVHFADNIGNVGVNWIKEVVESSIEMESKTNEEVFINMNTSALGTINPPNVLPTGLEFGYKTKKLKYRTLSGLIFIIRYKDILGYSHNSYWDGYNWHNVSGNFITPKPEFPRLNPSNPVSQFNSFFKTYKLDDYSDFYKIQIRVLKEAKYLEENGFSFSDE